MPDTISNLPSVDLVGALEPTALAAWLDFQFADHAAHNKTLLDRHAKFLEVTKDGINDDVMAGHAADFEKELKAEIKATYETHSPIKAPVLAAQRLIDGTAKTLTDKLAFAASSVTARITAYLRVKEVAARKAAEDEAARAALEADRAAREAAATNTPEAVDTAVAAIGQAQAAEARAVAPTAELSRTRSQGGALAGLRDNWTYAVENLSAVPAHLLTINDAAVKLAIKQGTREIPGLKIWNDAKAFVR